MLDFVINFYFSPFSLFTRCGYGHSVATAPQNAIMGAAAACMDFTFKACMDFTFKAAAIMDNFLGMYGPHLRHVWISLKAWKVCYILGNFT